MVEMLVAADYFPDPAFPFRLVRREPQGPVPLHRHEFAELVIILGGSGVHVTEDEEYSISTGDVFVLLGAQAHSFREMRELSLVNVIGHFAQLALPVALFNTLPGYHALFTLEPHYRRQHTFRNRLKLGAEEVGQVAAMLARMEAELAGLAPGYPAMVLGQLTQLIVYLSRCYMRISTPDAAAVLRLGEVLGAVHTRYTEPLTVESLADIAHLSASHFTRVFREAMGMPPLEYLIRHRIRQAAELLRDPRPSITQVAEQVGFTDANYFTRQFKAATGMNPRAYRKHAAWGGAAL